MKIVLLLNILCVISSFCFCEQKVTLKDVEIKFNKKALETDFTVTFSLKNLGVSSDSFWVGIGLNSRQQMNDANVVICMHTPTKDSVEHYYNQEYSSSYLDPKNPTKGIRNAKITIQNKTQMICSFTRENTNQDIKYFSINQRAHFIVAYFNGPIVAYHADNKAFTLRPVIFKSARLIQPVEVKSKLMSAANETIIAHLNESSPVFYFLWNQTENITHFSYYTNFTNQTTGLIPQDNVWSALILNNNTKIAEINLCKVENSSTLFKQFYLNRTSNATIGNNTVRYDLNGIQKFEVFYDNKTGILECSFYRLNKLSNSSEFFDLTFPKMYTVTPYLGFNNETNIEFDPYDIHLEENTLVNHPIAFWNINGTNSTEF